MKATHKIYKLSTIRRYIDYDTAIVIYKTMILPVMEYGCGGGNIIIAVSGILLSLT